MLRATGTARANNNQVRNRVDNKTHITVTPYIARSVHPTVRAAGGAPDKHKAAPPPRHPRQPWRWSSNVRRPVAELPTANPGSSTPQHRCRSGSTSTRPGVRTPTGWCRIPPSAPGARSRRQLPAHARGLRQRSLSGWPIGRGTPGEPAAVPCDIRTAMKTHGVRASRRPGQRRGGEPCPGPRADDRVPEVLLGVGLRLRPRGGGRVGCCGVRQVHRSATAPDEEHAARANNG